MAQRRRNLKQLRLAVIAASLTAVLTIRTLGQEAAPPPAPAGANPSAGQSSTAPAPVALDPAAILQSADATQPERDEAARRLVQRQTEDARKLLLRVLIDPANRNGQLAVARALQTDPSPDRRFIEPLAGLIAADPAWSDAAIGALAGYDAPEVENRLINLATDAKQRPSTRISAMRALGTMSDKRAGFTLVDLAIADAEQPAIRAAAADALAELTGLPAARLDPNQWARWRDDNRNKPDADFERDILRGRSRRLVRLQQQFNRVKAEQQAMLAEAYQVAPDNRREQILLRYLKATEPETREVGVTLVQSDFANNRAIPQAVHDQLRLMVADSSSRVRLLVAVALGTLNDANAFNALLGQLRIEPDPQVRAALANALVPMRDLRVVPVLLDLLHDPSVAVAETSANALRDLGPLIANDVALSKRVAAELSATLTGRTGGPGSTALRSALIDAMGATRSRDLFNIYVGVLRRGAAEPVPVRRAALRALGKLGGTANVIVASLEDPSEEVRTEALDALDATATWENAQALYDVLQNGNEKPAIRERAWGVLQNRFNDAPNDQLSVYADRFKNEPERRIIILEALAQHLVAAKDEAQLAIVRQNIGAEKMKLSDAAAKRGDAAEATTRAQEADKYFDLALQYYQQAHPRDAAMFTSALIEQREDALLASRQYPQAADFAATQIRADRGNQELMGRKLNNEVGRLQKTNQPRDAIALIDAIKKMDPPLAEQFMASIRAVEDAVRQNVGPQSAVGSGQ